METNKPDTTKEEIRALAEFLVHRLISEAVNMPEAAVVYQFEKWTKK
jgi:hypothetical protein